MAPDNFSEIICEFLYWLFVCFTAYGQYLASHPFFCPGIWLDIFFLSSQYPTDTAVMADKLTNAQLAIYRDTFKVFDKDQNGLITESELSEAMQALGQGLTEGQIKEMIAAVDADEDGAINFDEFLTLILKRFKDGDAEEELHQMFNMIDRDGDGKIDAEELTIAMGKIAENLGPDEIMAMLKEADMDGDGKINFEEFKGIMEPK